MLDDRTDWGGKIYGLDGGLGDVQDHLRELMRRAVTDWGYDSLKLDFLYYGTQGARSGNRHSPAEAYRAGVRAMREGALHAFVLGCGAPLQPSVGLADGMRIGSDVDASWGGIQPAARAGLLRGHLHRAAWLNDPDALVVREPLTLEEARAWASLVALLGGVTMFSDHLPRPSEERLDILRRTIPVAHLTPRLLDPLAPERAEAPALIADDGAWEALAVGTPWERVGHPGLDGYAWYRTRFVAPRRPPSGTQALALALGKIDDVDQTFLNGHLIGTTGVFPPAYRPEWQTYRRYAIAREVVRWGATNTLAVRVYDGGGGGGIWSLSRDRPPAFVLAPVRDERVRDVVGRGQRTVAPRSAVVRSLRRPKRTPFTIGSTRHVIPGGVDLAAERWDAGQRLLRGRSRRLDGRPYAVTIALPPGFRPRSCRSEVPCTLEAAGTAARTHGQTTVAGGAVRLVFPQLDRDELNWEVQF